jgi:hypothetical protein
VKYNLIRAWAKYMGSRDPYVRILLSKAIATNAPENAIFCNLDGTWATLDGCVPEVRTKIESIVAKIG